MLNSSFKTKKCIKIKVSIFFIVGAFLILFFWYYITAFCAVFKNVQLQLIKDMVITFILSMIYPFILNLIPALLRKYGLSSKKKCCFQLGKIISFI